jgi:hypothetical protein
MNQTLVGMGVVCIIAAIVGGGVEALGAKMPVLNSGKRQLFLAGFGIILMLIGFSSTDNSKTPPNATADKPSYQSPQKLETQTNANDTNISGSNSKAQPGVNRAALIEELHSNNEKIADLEAGIASHAVQILTSRN